MPRRKGFRQHSQFALAITCVMAIGLLPAGAQARQSWLESNARDPWSYSPSVVDGASELRDFGDEPRSTLYLAASHSEKKGGGDAKEMSAAQSEQCLAFARDPDADVGDVMRAGCEPTLAQMSALMDNPLGNVAMLFTQIDLMKLENPAFDKSANKWNYMGIAQFPKAITPNWNLINRLIWNVPSMPLDQDKIDRAADRASRGISSGAGGSVLPGPGAAPIDLFAGRETNLGDTYYVGLMSPSKPIQLGGGAKFLWGAGITAGAPTATKDILGTGKWTLGPSALAVYMGPKWKVGGLATNYFDVAGPSNRDDVGMTNLQLFYYYSLNPTTSIGAGPNIIANWREDSDNFLTVPVGLGINKTIQMGKVPVRIGAEFFYSVIQPDDTVGTEWNLRFYIIPAAPAPLFPWMTKPMFGGG